MKWIRTGETCGGKIKRAFQETAVLIAFIVALVVSLQVNCQEIAGPAWDRDHIEERAER